MVGKRWSFDDSKRLARLYNSGEHVNIIISKFPDRTRDAVYMKIDWLKRKEEITELRPDGPIKGTKYGYRIDAGERPPCPRCDYEYTQSAGRSWRCPECEKWWLKKHPKSMIRAYQGSVTSEGFRKFIGPSCPRCGEKYPFSRGKAWKCPECGRHYAKNPKYGWGKVGRPKKGT